MPKYGNSASISETTAHKTKIRPISTPWGRKRVYVQRREQLLCFLPSFVPKLACRSWIILHILFSSFRQKLKLKSCAFIIVRVELTKMNVSVNETVLENLQQNKIQMARKRNTCDVLSPLNALTCNSKSGTHLGKSSEPQLDLTHCMVYRSAEWLAWRSWNEYKLFSPTSNTPYE